MKTKLVLRPGILARKFDEKKIFGTFLGFNQHWDFKHYNEYLCQKCIKLLALDKIHLKCVAIGGSVANGTRQLKLYSFV